MNILEFYSQNSKINPEGLYEKGEKLCFQPTCLQSAVTPVFTSYRCVLSFLAHKSSKVTTGQSH